MQQHSPVYTLKFSAMICIACSLLVSSAAVGLKAMQERNATLDMRQNVLMAAGFLDNQGRVIQDDGSSGEKATPADIERLFERIEPVLVDMGTGEELGEAPDGYDIEDAMKDPALSTEAPPNRAQVQRVPKKGLVYEVKENGQIKMVILPIQGKGLWSTLKGFLAVDADGNTIRGLTYYSHAETPGLGGEVDNPLWKSRWPGREIYNAQGEVAIKVIKGAAPPPEEAPHKVDGLSGATITANGVSHMMDFWLGENAYGPFLKTL